MRSSPKVTTLWSSAIALSNAWSMAAEKVNLGMLFPPLEGRRGCGFDLAPGLLFQPFTFILGKEARGVIHGVEAHDIFLAAQLYYHLAYVSQIPAAREYGGEGFGEGCPQQSGGYLHGLLQRL